MRNQDIPRTATRFLILGAGPVGFHLGRELSGRARVLFADADPRVAEGIRARGHDVLDPAIGLDAFDFHEEDVIILATKSTAAACALEPIPDGIPIISVSNGFNPGLRAARPGFLFFGIIDFAASRAASGEVICTRRGSITLPRASPRRATIRLAAALRGSSIRARLTDDIVGHIWSKLLLNSSLDTVAAMTGQTLGQVFIHRPSLVAFQRLLREGLAVARAAGISLHAIQGITPSALERILKTPLLSRGAAYLAGRSAFRIESTILSDLRRGLPTEIEHLNAHIVRTAEGLGMDAPAHRRAIGIIREIEMALRAPDLSAALALLNILERKAVGLRRPRGRPGQDGMGAGRADPTSAAGPPSSSTHSRKSASPSSSPISGE